MDEYTLPKSTPPLKGMHHKCGYTHAMDGTNKVRVLAPRLISRDTEDTMQLGPREYKLTGYH